MQKVDVNALKFNQFNIIYWLLLAYLFDWQYVTLVIGLAMAVGALWPNAGPFRIVYLNMLVTAGLVKPKIIQDDPAPHRFALGFGAVVVLIGALLLRLDFAALGWALMLLVVLLAAINFFFNFCVGCQIYYLLGRVGLVKAERG
jgi:hypothetical protein